MTTWEAFVPMMGMTAFIKEERVRQGITQRGMAQRVKVHGPALCDLESGKRTKLPVSWAIAMLDELGYRLEIVKKTEEG